MQLPRRLPVVATAVLGVGLAAAIASAASSPGFRYGVAAGEMTSSSARLWTRAPRFGAVVLSLSSAAGTRRFVLQATVASDLTVERTVGGLRPGTTYRYAFSQDGARSDTGAFRTAPAPNATGTVRFAISGDADATAGPGGKPGFNGFETYGAMARARNDFDLNFGDTIYSDSELAGAAVARTVAQKRVKYRLGLALEPLRRLRRSTGVYSGWDDHEFVNDFSRAEHGAADLPRRRAGVPRLHAGDVPGADGALPELPMGQEPRALPARRAELPQRQGDRGVRRRHRADRTGRRTPGVRCACPGSREAGFAVVPGTIASPARTLLGQRSSRRSRRRSAPRPRRSRSSSTRSR